MTDYDHEFETEEDDIAEAAPATLTDFLLARIAEDEAAAGQVDDLSGDWIEEPHWTPARVLAECEAKRRIVERHKDCGKGYGYCDDSGHGWYDEAGTRCPDLEDLALPYADHPDWREEWAR